MGKKLETKADVEPEDSAKESEGLRKRGKKDDTNNNATTKGKEDEKEDKPVAAEASGGEKKVVRKRAVTKKPAEQGGVCFKLTVVVVLSVLTYVVWSLFNEVSYNTTVISI